MIPEKHHGSEEIMYGKLTGCTDTDYFYFFCPSCKDILQTPGYEIHKECPKEENPYNKNLPGFVIVFSLKCPKCGLKDFVKIGNLGRQGGKKENLRQE